MKRILIANRGEIARRVIATAQRMGLETVAVFSEPDAKALHVQEATLAYALGGKTSAESYLNLARLLEAARATGADAVHPGYGFLSEDAGFAQAVQDAGLIWIGPPPAAIRQLGSKAAAKALAQAHDVPCLPGYAGEDQSDARFAKEAQAIGFPVMVKAVAGGGGRGMRLVSSADQLVAAAASARSEALAGFGNGDLLIERAVMHPRHVEVQIFADAHGQVVHLGERDCSVQRRHQKIIEEAPSPAVDAALRERMGACAVTLARAAGYVGAGTVEFLLEGNHFFLMEMNTRLQVEHPVTEALTGLDLVEWQIRVARGEPLPLGQSELRFQGHAMEVRLCAEDEMFRPHTGQIQHLKAPAATCFEVGALRFDHALQQGSEVSPFYDAMLGKLIVYAATRAEAIEQLTGALRRLELLGLPTNRAFLIECLQDETFKAGQALISFLATDAERLQTQLHEKEGRAQQSLSVLCSLGDAPSRLACPYPQPRRLRHRGQTADLYVKALGRQQWQVQYGDGRQEQLQAHSLEPGEGAQSWQVALGDCSQMLSGVCFTGLEGQSRWHMQAHGVDWWVEDVSYLPPAAAGGASVATELRAPFNGKLLKLAVQPGQRLQAGEAALVIESMKLEHSLAAPAAVVVAEVLVSEGQQVMPGQVLLRFAAAESAVQPAAQQE